MDKRAVNEKSKDLQQATAAGADSEVVFRILNELKTGVKPDESLLRSTKIGIIVNKSKNHKDAKVAKLAGEIVKGWRDEVRKQGTASPSNRAGRSSPAGTASPLPVNGSTKSKPTVPLDKRDYKADKVNIERTNQSSRDKSIGLMYNGLCYTVPDPASEVIRAAIAVEEAVFSLLGPESNEGYVVKMRSLYMNLKNKSNPQLRRRVLDGDTTPEQLVKMKAEDLKSDKRKEEDRALMKENMKEAQVRQLL